jgi:hypothetical protein
MTASSLPAALRGGAAGVYALEAATEFTTVEDASYQHEGP